MNHRPHPQQSVWFSMDQRKYILGNIVPAPAGFELSCDWQFCPNALQTRQTSRCSSGTSFHLDVAAKHLPVSSLLGKKP